MGSNFDFDVIVVGGGPGGYEAAIRCAQYHLRTALIEMDKLGGTCLNRGCIPTKALLHSAEAYADLKSLPKMGIHVGDIAVDYAAMVARKDAIVTQLRNGIAALEASHGVTVIEGRGVLKDAHSVSVGDAVYTAESIILSMGSKPSKPPIPGIDQPNILSSDDVLALTALPKRVTIVGGGVIGLEFSTLFSSLGSKVTIIEMLPALLPALDDDLVRTFLRTLKSAGVEIHTSAAVSSLTGGTPTICKYTENGKECSVEGDICIVCTGRSPMTRDMNLEACGVNISKRGFVEINDCMQTSIPNIYAIGDITGKIQLAHVATAQGMVAAANVSGRVRTMRYDVVPACIYTAPEIAYVGLSTKQAADAGYETVQGSFNVAGNGRALAMGKNVGTIRIVAEKKSGRILGAQLMAPHATDMIGELCTAVRLRLRLDELGGIIHPHPTVCECISEAAHAAEGLCCNAMKAK